MPRHHRASEHTGEPMWFVITVSVITAIGGAVIGWNLRSGDVPRFEEIPAISLESVLSDLDRVGVSCAGDLQITTDGTGTQVATCRADPTFSIKVFDNVTESYESLDFAIAVACIRIGLPPPPQWHMIRRGTWNLLTYDHDLATSATLVPGATATTGRCVQPVEGDPVGGSWSSEERIQLG